MYNSLDFEHITNVDVLD